MENQSSTEPAVTVEVTGLQPVAETVEQPQPEIVVIETTIEQTPESATAWQERLERSILEALANSQNQMIQMVETVQTFRQTLQQMMDCLARIEERTPLPSIQIQQSQPEISSQPAEPAPAQVSPQVAEAPLTEQHERERTPKKRHRI